MRKLNLLFKSLFLLCALIVGSSSTWAGEPVVIWSEDFTGATADQPITTPTNNLYSGVTYTCTNGTGTSPGNTIVKNENTGGHQAPELMVGKKGGGNEAAGGKFTAVIPLDKFEGTLTLTYYQNKQTLKVSSPTTGVSGGQSLKPSAVGQQTTTFTGVTAAMTSITIVFEATTTNNVRLDNIVLTGTKASGKTPTTVTINGTPSTEVYMGDAVTNPSGASVKAGGSEISTAVTWSSSNTDVATINPSNGTITLVGPGATTIKAIFAETATHNGSEASYTLNVYGVATTLAGLQSICKAYGNTAMKAKVTLNNVYVTGVKNNNAYISDGTNGAVIYKNSHGFNAGDKLSCSALEMTVVNYNGAAEITSLTSGSTGLTVTPGQTITPTAMSVNAITAANYGTLVKIIGVTYDATAGAFKDNSDNSIVFYDYFSANPTLNDGEEYDVTGVILLKNNTITEICPRTAADVVAKSIKTTPTSAWKLGGNAVSSIAVTKGGSVTASFETNSTGTKTFESSNTDVATVSNTGTISLTGTAGIAIITATTAANNTYYVSESSLIVVVGEPVVDGVFDFTGYQDYGSGVIPTSANDYTEVDKTWTAGNIAMTTSGKIRWYIGTNGLDLKLYTKKVSEIETTKFTVAAPAGKKLTKIVISGSGHGSLVAEGYNADTWTGLADNVTFTYGGSGTIGITKITVYYEGPTISVTMNNEGYMTYCNVGAALSFAGVKAYKVSSVADDHVNLIEVTEAPANTPVILEANPGNYNLTVIASATSVGTNKLRVSDGTAMNTDQYDVYALAKKEKGVGFYKLGDDVTVPAGKCYISVSKSVQAPTSREFLSIGDDATGIKAVDGVTERGVVYDLQGRRVDQPTRGLYIENGKKVIIK